MSPEPRDELDRALAAGLGGLAPDGDDPDVALSSMRPRLRRARNRRRMVRASTMLGGFVMMGSVAFALTGPQQEKVRVQAPSTTRPAPARATSPTRVSATTAPRSSTPSTTVTAAPPPAARPTVPVGGGAPPTSAPAPDEATTTTIQSELRTYSSDGGTITVRYSHGNLTLVSYRAAPGYTAEVHSTDPQDVEVRFSGPDEHRIRIRAEEGHLSEETE
jgi:hypothetical protein